MAATSKNTYPGAGVPLRHYPQGWRNDYARYAIGAHQNCWGSTSALLTVREVAMMALMNKLTDKPGWHEKVFNADIVAKWRQEAMTQSEDDLYREITDGRRYPHVEGRERRDKIPKPLARLISEQAFDYCLEELRSKAEFFGGTGLVPVLDSVSAAMLKSDSSVPLALHGALRAAFEKLATDQSQDIDWHPQSNDMVQDLVHPSMYPLIYGRSNFLQDELVGVHDAVSRWAGLGDSIAKQDQGGNADHPNTGWGGDSIPPEYWSDNYQWLPANMAFQNDGSVKFSSYINNLHPKTHPEIYSTIEKLVDIAIPAWGHCLIVENSSREEEEDGTACRQPRARIDLPDEAYDDNEELWEPEDEALARTGIEFGIDNISDLCDERGIDIPEPESGAGEELNESEEQKKGRQLAFLLENHSEDVKEWMWKQVREPLLPEPNEFSAPEYDYSRTETLRNKFRETGLQVIVKMASIELTPEKPEFSLGGWHVEGMMNEHVCATALYYVSSENVTTSHLSFRMQTSYDQDDIQEKTGQDAYNWLERVHGVGLGPSGNASNSCLQNYGAVETRQGRLLVFPNTFQHRVSSFKLQDPTKPGHRRFIALWLVDPHRRIVSTANVPPQRLDWWVDAVFGNEANLEQSSLPPEILRIIKEQRGVDLPVSEEGKSMRSRLPNEIMDMIRKQGVVPKGLMDVEEAKQHRLALMAERSRFHEVSKNNWESVEYFFCEH